MRYVLKAGSVHPSRGPEGVKYTLWEPWPSVTSLPPLPLVVSGAPAHAMLRRLINCRLLLLLLLCSNVRQK